MVKHAVRTRRLKNSEAEAAIKTSFNDQRKNGPAAKWVNNGMNGRNGSGNDFHSRLSRSDRATTFAMSSTGTGKGVPLHRNGFQEGLITGFTSRATAIPFSLRHRADN